MVKLQHQLLWEKNYLILHIEFKDRLNILIIKYYMERLVVQQVHYNHYIHSIVNMIGYK